MLNVPVKKNGFYYYACLHVSGPHTFTHHHFVASVMMDRCWVRFSCKNRPPYSVVGLDAYLAPAETVYPKVSVVRHHNIKVYSSVVILIPKSRKQVVLEKTRHWVTRYIKLPMTNMTLPILLKSWQYFVASHAVCFFKELLTQSLIYTAAY